MPVIELTPEETMPKMSKGLRLPYLVIALQQGIEEHLYSYATAAEAEEKVAFLADSKLCRIFHLNLPPMEIQDD